MRVTHDTRFDTGPAIETFSFVRDDEDLKLMGYDIKNPNAPGADSEDEKE